MSAGPVSSANIGNLLLRTLSDRDLARFRAELRPVALPAARVVMVPGEPVECLYFVESGIVSIISRMETGEQVEVGIIGPEGLVGLSVLLGAPTSPFEGLVQVPGSALTISTPVFSSMTAELPAFRSLMLRYVDSFYVQISQSAACNGHHKIEHRLARWILMAHDRVEGDAFMMTQEFMSYMLGVQRPSVTIAVGTLQKMGLINHDKGIMTILDRPGLEGASCECYAVAHRRLEWLVGAKAQRR